ncbi:3-oxoadipate enol-lactonase [Fibrella aquatilis]|uniref:3-oxoadipate enol-lactonase n=1 Tax=Fibrella aquatilis TaxID=2817059 RepID=A0A939G342_9BACT|nr:3-oxoadipate enol-lactonase [Fibrella aquatilis]MBO0929729.1 3-oxoadipate enol-lactonase [Fibrella aquatilis]
MPFAQVHHRAVHYQWADHGQPHTLVFINSLGTDLRIWDEVVQRLGTSVNMLRYDKRGHGLSEGTPASQLATGTMDAFTDDLIGLLDVLGIDRCIPVGLSVGGRIALVLADKQPERVERLILCDTAHIIGTLQSWDERIRAVQTLGLEQLSGQVMERWFTPDFGQHNASTVAIFRRMLMACAPADYIRCCEAVRDADLTEQARRIGHPTRCIVGTGDVATPPALVRQLADLITGADYHELEGSGHLPCVDNPARLTTLIADFLHD